MTLQLIDKRKIYFYSFLLLILLSIHNTNSLNFINNFFKIKKIEVIGNIDQKLNSDISLSLEKFYNINIFSLDVNDIKSELDIFAKLSEYNIKKEYPSSINIELKETNFLAYFFDNNQKYFVGENGKKIKEEENIINNLPLIVGQFEIKRFLNLKDLLLKNGFQLNDFSSFYSFKSNRWDLVYKNKITIKLPIDELEHSIFLLKSIIETQNIDNLNLIDLRISNRIIVA